VFSRLGRILFAPAYEDQQLIDLLAHDHNATANRVDVASALSPDEGREQPASGPNVDPGSDPQADPLLDDLAPELERLKYAKLLSPLVTKVSFARFKVENVPALLLPDEDSEVAPLSAGLEQRIRDAASKQDAAEIVYELRRELAGIDKDFGKSRWTLVLNIDNPLIEKFRHMEEGIGVSVGLRDLFHTAYMIAAGEYDDRPPVEAWNGTAQLLDHLIDLQGIIRDLNAELKQKERELRDAREKVAQAEGLSAEAKHREERVNELLSKQEELVQANEGLSAEANRRDEKIDELLSKQEQLVQSNEGLGADLKRREEKIVELSSEKEELEATLEKTQQQLRETEEKLLQKERIGYSTGEAFDPRRPVDSLAFA
jgi:hypothetical protein